MIVTSATEFDRSPIFIGRRGENLATQICFDVPTDLAEYDYTVYVRRPKECEAYPAAYISKSGNSIVWTVSNVDTAFSGAGWVQIRFTENDVVVKTIVYRTEVGPAIDISTSEAPEWQETWLDALTDLSEQTHANAEAAAISETNAKASELNAKSSEENASASEQNAKISENNAKASEDAALLSEQHALESEQAADDYSEDAEAWAVGKRNNVDVSSSDPTYQNNSKWYAERSADAGGFAWFEVDNETGEAIVTVTDKLAQDVSFAINTSNGTLEVTVS